MAVGLAGKPQQSSPRCLLQSESFQRPQAALGAGRRLYQDASLVASPTCAVEARLGARCEPGRSVDHLPPGYCSSGCLVLRLCTPISIAHGIIGTTSHRVHHVNSICSITSQDAVSRPQPAPAFSGAETPHGEGGRGRGGSCQVIGSALTDHPIAMPWGLDETIPPVESAG